MTSPIDVELYIPSERIAESATCTPLGERLFRLEGLPFFLQGVAFGDTFEAEHTSTGLQLIRVVSSSVRKTYQLILADQFRDSAQLKEVQHKIEMNNGLWTQSGGLLSISMPETSKYDPSIDLLDSDLTRSYKDKMLKVAGRVTSGRGDFGQWIRKLQDHYERLTGMRFFPGTLNIQLDQPYELPTRRLRLDKETYGGSVSVSLVPCRIRGQDAFVLRTDANDQGIGDHPNTVVEIASDIRLREVLGLSDGDEIELELPLE